MGGEVTAVTLPSDLPLAQWPVRFAQALGVAEGLYSFDLLPRVAGGPGALCHATPVRLLVDEEGQGKKAEEA